MKKSNTSVKNTTITRYVGCWSGNFLWILTTIFVVLKALNIIHWSWVWVLSPLWIGWIVAILIVIIALIISLIASKD